MENVFAIKLNGKRFAIESRVLLKALELIRDFVRVSMFHQVYSAHPGPCKKLLIGFLSKMRCSDNEWSFSRSSRKKIWKLNAFLFAFFPRDSNGQYFFRINIQLQRAAGTIFFSFSIDLVRFANCAKNYIDAWCTEVGGTGKLHHSFDYNDTYLWREIKSAWIFD